MTTRRWALPITAGRARLPPIFFAEFASPSARLPDTRETTVCDSRAGPYGQATRRVDDNRTVAARVRVPPVAGATPHCGLAFSGTDNSNATAPAARKLFVH